MSKIYYVSRSKGQDGYSGCSPQEAFYSLQRVSQEALQPGDKIYLERGSVFEDDYLHLEGVGDKEGVVEITSYGEGEMPVIACNGQGIWYQDYGTPLDAPTHVYRDYVSSGILLYDCINIYIHDLEITNKPKRMIGETYYHPKKMNRTGVSVIACQRGCIQDIHLANLYIHDVEGNIYDKHMNNGGIYCSALKPTDGDRISRFKNILIEGCSLKRVSRWGIGVGYTYNHAYFQGKELEEAIFRKYGHEQICIKNNYLEDIGGDGITTMYTLEPIIEHNCSIGCARQINALEYPFPEDRGGMVAAGIWPWKCKNALFRYNEVLDTSLNQDGMAYDADSGDGTIYEYNYSRLNEGGCIMFCLEESVNNIFRHNVSVDDLGGLISPAQNPDAYIGHNIFYKRKATPFIRRNMDGGNYVLEDNQIIDIDEEVL